MDTDYFQEPVLTKTKYGDWLATTRHESDLRIGVLARTEENARLFFDASLQRWKEINEIENKNDAGRIAHHDWNV